MTFSPDIEVSVVGRGPAGVSVAFPLVEAGIKTLMVDGGNVASGPLPATPFLTERANSHEQWKWMLGEDFHALHRLDAISPKFRVPAHSYVFRDFLKRNRIVSEKVVAVGSLARGGLSNAWGCGVARLSTAELSAFPFSAADILPSYARVARRIGLSGSQADDMADYFGIDDWVDPALPLDSLNEHLWTQYVTGRNKIPDFRLGRARIAVLARERGQRQPCNLTGNCLWGCSRGALYSAADEIDELLRFPTFQYRAVHVVDIFIPRAASLSWKEPAPVATGRYEPGGWPLAAGTLATTRLATRAIGYREPLKLQSCPSAAFLLWLPRMMGSERRSGFGLGQLSFALRLSNEEGAFGATFSTTGIPLAEFARYLPLRTRYGIDMLRHLLGACLVGNVFLPSHYSDLTVRLEATDELRIEGGCNPLLLETMSHTARQLRQACWALGAILVPSSFSIATPGSDVHYACSLPMRAFSGPGETDPYGELIGFPGLHVVDGACLSVLGEKSHTLTIMANADRIGKIIAEGISRKWNAC